MRKILGGKDKGEKYTVLSTFLYLFQARNGQLSGYRLYIATLHAPDQSDKSHKF